jgi:hypothetical protein
MPIKESSTPSRSTGSACHVSFAAIGRHIAAQRLTLAGKNDVVGEKADQPYSFGAAKGLLLGVKFARFYRYSNCTKTARALQGWLDENGLNMLGLNGLVSKLDSLREMSAGENRVDLATIGEKAAERMVSEAHFHQRSIVVS